MIKTLTVDELIALLTKCSHDTKVFMSVDQEGNGYSSLSAYSLDLMPQDNVVILNPAQERLDIDEICPEWWKEQE